MIRPFCAKRFQSYRSFRTFCTNVYSNGTTIKQKILESSLPFITRYGWTRETLAAGAESAKYPGVAHGLIEDPSSELVFHLYRKFNSEFVDHLQQNPKGEVKIGDFVSEKLRYRLEMILPYIDKWPEAVAILSKPWNVATAAELLLRTCDDVWYFAGDRSSDFTWYTKRIPLMGIYTSSQLFLLQDESPNYEETWKFMKRRLVDVRTAGTAFSQIQNGIATSFDLGYSLFHTVRNVVGMNASNR